MDKQQFEQFLEQVAVLKNTGPNGCKAKPKKPVKRIRIEIDEWGEEVEIEEFEVPEDNLTLAPIIDSLKPVERPCQLSCGKVVVDQKINMRLYPKPFKHFRTHCNTCMKWQNPYGQMVVSNLIEPDYYRFFSERDK